MPKSRSYADLDTSQIFGGADRRIYEREEFDTDRAECRTQDAEFSWPQILGAVTSSRPSAGTRKSSGPISETKNWQIGNWRSLS
jgi:hypothetical protein